MGDGGVRKPTVGVSAGYRNPTKKIWTQNLYLKTPTIQTSASKPDPSFHLHGPNTQPLTTTLTHHPTQTFHMADTTAAQPASAPGDRVVIGISFGNSSSSIAVTVDDKAEVIANEDGGEGAPRPTYHRR